MSDFDTGKFLKDYWPDAEALTAFLHAYGHKQVKQPMVNQWFLRDQVPAKWWPILVSLAEVDRGQSILISKYMR